MIFNDILENFSLKLSAGKPSDFRRQGATSIYKELLVLLISRKYLKRISNYIALGMKIAPIINLIICTHGYVNHLSIHKAINDG